MENSVQKIKLQLVALADFAALFVINVAELDVVARIVASVICTLVGIATFIRLVSKFRVDAMERRLKRLDLQMREEEVRKYFEKLYGGKKTVKKKTKI